MIHPIDSFKVEYNMFIVTFVRVANNVGWFGTFQGSDERWGDFITFDAKDISKTTKEEMLKTFEVLAEQAAQSLIDVRDKGGSVSEFAEHLKSAIHNI